MRSGCIVVGLLAARTATADIGLVATVAVPGAPSDLRTARFEVTLTNASAAPIVLDAWKDASWRLTITGPDHIAGGCVQPVADEPSQPLALAPHAAHAFHFRCATGLHALLRAGTYRLRIVYANEKQPSCCSPTTARTTTPARTDRSSRNPPERTRSSSRR